MAGRTLVRRGVRSRAGASVDSSTHDSSTLKSSTVGGSSSVARPHFLERPRGQRNPPSERPAYTSPPVKLHTDDWMHVELPRGDYLMAGLVALSIAAAVGSVTLLPAVLIFNLPTLAASFWPKLMLALPLLSGILGAWACLRRAKSDRLRQRLSEELRD